MLTTGSLCAKGFGLIELGGGEYLLREAGSLVAFWVTLSGKGPPVQIEIEGKMVKTMFTITCPCCTCTWLKDDFPWCAVKGSGIKRVVMHSGSSGAWEYHSGVQVVTIYDAAGFGRIKVQR